MWGRSVSSGWGVKEVGSYLLKVPPPSHTVLPGRDQVFKQLSLWGTLHIETITRPKVSKVRSIFTLPSYSWVVE